MTHGFETLAIHAGQAPDALTGSVVPPIHQTSTFAQDGVGRLRGGYEYSRSANPTRTALESCLAALETAAGGLGLAGGDGPDSGAEPDSGADPDTGAEPDSGADPDTGAEPDTGADPDRPAAGMAATALAFASGLAAEDCLLRTVLGPGDHVVIPDDAYGGTFRLVSQVFERWGVEHTPVRLSDLAAVAAAIRPGRTRLLWCETPSNPLLGVADLAGLAGLAHRAGALLAVDNTFASPYLQQPLRWGADVVVYSTTKYLGGHSDVVGGALVVGAGTSQPELAERLRFHQNAMGAIPGPFDCWLVLRGIRTLGVRMDRHSQNARQIVAGLAGHPAVRRVLWPGLAGHPGHEVAARQMRDFGGMVSLLLRGGEAAAVALCERTRLFTLAESLGGVESLIEHPARMTHASVAGSALEVPAELVRLSVGIESAADLLDDLLAALATVG